MDIQAYIESGVLEEYCLGFLDINEQNKLIEMSLLYPEVKLELDAIELAMEKLAAINAIVPTATVKQKIFDSIGYYDTEARLDVNNLPVTGKHSNPEHWLNTYKHLIPENPGEEFLCELLRHDEYVTQMFVVTSDNVPEETHSDVLESFFILQGKCECTVGDHLYKLSPGDFLEIPLHTEHNIKITSPYVVAILQHQAL